MSIRAVAVLWAFNEEDFIAWSIRHLLAQGIDLQIFDNWSTDRTFEILQGFGSDIKCERWPENRQECSSLTSRLVYLEEFALKTDYDWLINHDVDEIRRTKTGETLMQFIERIDGDGYNAIDHSCEVYFPKEGWDGSQNPEEFFDQRMIGHTDERSPQIKAWKKQSGDAFGFTVDGRPGQARGVNLWATGGHQAIFPDRKVTPEKLVLKHYPLRTQAHAERKIAERKRSYAPDELAWGWHHQYRTPWWK